MSSEYNLKRDTLRDTLRQISNDIFVESDMPYGIISGISGVTIFNAHSIKHSLNVSARLSLQNTFDKSFEKIASGKRYDTSFGYGLSGYLWHLNELAKMELIDLDAELSDVVTFFRSKILESISADITANNIDFLNGVLGKIASLFPLSKEEFPIVGNFIDYLFNRIVKSVEGLYSLRYFDGYDQLHVKHVNMGLAHGIPGILKLCTMFKKNNLFNTKIEAIANACFDFFLVNVNEDTTHCYYPSFIQLESNRSCEKSRLAWCYGDLSLAYVLLTSGNAFQHTAIQNLAIEILRSCASRRNLKDNQVMDASVCHGSSGVAHLFHKTWRIVNDPIFYDAAEFWIDRTLEFAVIENGKTVYKRFDAKNNVFRTECNLLAGMAGVGLVLSSWLTGDTSWDACLMLND